MDISTAAMLSEIYVRGVVANMLMIRGEAPTDEELDFLLGKKDITARTLGEIAGRLDFSLRITMSPHDLNGA